MPPGFQSPNHTQTPNDLFDKHLANMEKSELKVVLAVIRQTLGFHRRQTRISMRDIEKTTGLAYESVYNGAEAAEARGLLKRHQDGGITEWEIIWNDPPDMGVEGDLSVRPAIQPVDQGDLATETAAVQPLDQSGLTTETPSTKESPKERISKEIPKEKTLAPAAQETQSVEEMSHDIASQIYSWGLMSEGKMAYWQTVPEHLQEILGAFTMVWCDTYGRKLMKGDRRKFIKQAEVLYSDFGGEGVADFVVEAGKRHKEKKGMSMNGPSSIRYLIREVIEEAAEEEEATQENAEFWDAPIGVKV